MDNNNLNIYLNGESLSFERSDIPQTDDLSVYRTRCVDGRYTSDQASRDIIAFPGGTPGVFAVLLSALRTCSDDVTYDSRIVMEKFLDLIKGPRNITFHTENHGTEHNPQVLAKGCGHMRLMRQSPQKYYLDGQDIELIEEFISMGKEANVENEAVLEGGHEEKLVLVIQGLTNVMPIGKRENGQDVQAFIFNTYSLDILTHVALHMVQSGTVTLDGEMSAEDLAGVLSDTAALHLSLTVAELAKGLPVFKVSLSESQPSIEALGEVEADSRIDVNTLISSLQNV